MALVVGLFYITQAVSYHHMCQPEAFPPWLPKIIGYHNTIEPVALGNGYVLCCNGRWGVAPLQTGYIKKLVVSTQNVSESWAILSSKSDRISCEDKSLLDVTKVPTAQIEECEVPNSPCDPPCEPLKESCVYGDSVGVCSSKGRLCRRKTETRQPVCRAFGALGIPDTHTNGACVSVSGGELFAKCCGRRYGRPLADTIRLYPDPVPHMNFGVYTSLNRCLAAHCATQMSECNCDTPEYVCRGNEMRCYPGPNTSRYIYESRASCTAQDSVSEFQSIPECEQACTASNECRGIEVNSLSSKCTLIHDECTGAISQSNSLTQRYRRKKRHKEATNYWVLTYVFIGLGVGVVGAVLILKHYVK